MKIKPLLDNILVKPLPTDQEKSEIIIPDLMKKQVNKGIVVGVADGVTEVRIGQGIEWKELSGTYIEDFILVSLSDVLYTFDP